MMKRAHIGEAITTRDASGLSAIPAGPCWVLERAAWVALIWDSTDGRQQVELPLRDYNAHVKSGRIQFTSVQTSRWMPRPPPIAFGPAIG